MLHVIQPRAIVYASICEDVFADARLETVFVVAFVDVTVVEFDLTKSVNLVVLKLSHVDAAVSPL